MVMKTVLLSLAMFAPLFVNAQIKIGGDLPPILPIEKTVFDSALVKVYYEYAYRPDSTRHDKWRRGQTVLLLGGRYTGFTDYYSLQSDSLNDAFYNEKRSPMELVGPIIGLMRNQKYDRPLVINNAENTATVQLGSFLKVEYRQQLAPLNWTVLGGDSVIAGVHCKKAACRMGGRDWVAWYSEEYNMPVGPYLFRGLPGLIFAVSDTKNNYTFTLNGLQMLAKPEPVYLRANDDMLKLSREDAFKARRNENDDPMTAIKMSGKTVFVEDWGDYKPNPYNPIELE